MPNKQFSINDERQIRSVLESHHKAAAVKDPDAFFSIFAPDAIFIGSDDAEEWTRHRLIEVLNNSDSGWDMTDCRERHVYPVPEKPEVAAFFEVVNHKKYGLMRGSGMVVKNRFGDWCINHYVLSFSVPNQVVDKTNILDLLAQKA